MARPVSKTGKRTISAGLPEIYFILQIFAGVWLSFWLLYNHQPQTGDDIEHIHSSWLVWQGKVPYKDFFQHHNPLLWYLFAPLTGFFAYNLTVLDIVRIISTVVMFGSLFVAARIIQKFISENWYAGIIGVASVFPSYIIFSGQDFRPDNYMTLAFMLGMYWFFMYLQKSGLKYLVFSFFSMFIAFMFMQKVVFMLAFFGCVVLWLLHTGGIRKNDFFRALILPLCGGLLFLLWLWHHNMIERYWLANYIFNLYIPDVYGGLVEKTKPEFYVLSAISFAGCLYFIRYGNVYGRIMSFLWLAEAIQRFFFFSLDRHYYYQLQLLNAVMVGAAASVMIKKRQWAVWFFVVVFFVGCLSFKDYCLQNKLAPEYHRYVTPKYVLEQTNRCDAVLNGYGLTYGVFTKDVTYYWNLNGQLDVIGSKIGLPPLSDLNRVVLQYFPRIIYTAPYWNEKLRKQHIDRPVHWINKKIRDKYYEQSLFMDIFILKPEYQERRRCRYNAETDSWNYFYKEPFIK